MAKDCGQPLEAELSPGLEANERMGTPVLPLQGTEFGQQPHAFVKGPRKECSPTGTLTAAL